MFKQPTKEAQDLKHALEKLGIRVLAEVDDGHKHIDLCIPDAKINVEVDGSQHFTDAHQILSDLSRSHFSDDIGYNTIHIPNALIHANLGGIASALAEAAKIREEQLKTYKKLVIQPYSTEWPDKYQKEANIIKGNLGELVLDIQHIGSTAVPNLSAKPIIDIAVLTNSISSPNTFTEILEKIGYSYKPDMSSAERIFLRKGSPVQYHLSISESKYSYWKRQILFRDYLCQHQEALLEYQKIKDDAIKGLSKNELNDLSLSEEYNGKKGPFIEKILKQAEVDCK